MISAPAFADLVSRLMPAPAPPVWSILVTVFGDLAQGPGAAISGAGLRALTEPMGLSDEAVRTALHRLRRDGWIVSRRAGRATAHALSERGHAESRAAAASIYARDAAATRANLLITDPTATAPDLPGLRLAPGLMLAAATVPGAMVVSLSPGTALPAWMTDRLCTPDLRTRAADLAVALTAVAARLDCLPPPAPTQAAILRVLVVHGWRRIALRLPPLPDHIYPAEWQVPQCRILAADLLDRLPIPDQTG